MDQAFLCLNSAESLDHETLQRYLETRKAITERFVAHLLGLLKQCGEDSIPVSPSAIAKVADMIDSDICGIQETLDEFIYVLDAEAVLLE